MTPDDERREARRRWAAGVVTDEDDPVAAELAFWRLAGDEARYRALWDLVLEAWAVEHPDEPLPRLDRSASGLRRGRR